MRNAKRAFIRILTFVTILLVTIAGFARDYSAHEGYTSDVREERSEIVTELTAVSAPAPLGPPLQDRIFDEKITKDFRERYEQKFGRTEAERVYNSPNRFTYYNDLYTFKGSPQEESSAKRDFANYMVKKLAEYHVENYAKSDPKVRPMWEAKEKLSQMQVQTKSFKVKAKYDLVGGKADIELVNPVVDTQLTLDMAGTSVEESLLILRRPITSTIGVESRYRNIEGILAFVGTKTYTPNFSTNLTVSTFTNDSTKSVRESLYLAGASYLF